MVTDSNIVVVEHDATNGLPPWIGMSMAVLAGLLYGNNFTPPTYMMDSGEGMLSHETY